MIAVGHQILRLVGAARGQQVDVIDFEDGLRRAVNALEVITPECRHFRVQLIGSMRIGEGRRLRPGRRGEW